MKEVKVLDCTLRDGGYVNNWNFGHDNIIEIKDLLENSGVDVIEMGFIRQEEYNADRTIYSSMEELKKVMGKKKPGKIYSAILEMANYYPPEKLAPMNEEGPDLIRYTFWKRKLDEAYDYCKMIVDKGYKLGVQPTRIEQYSEEEFKELCIRFSKLKPYAIYIVDTFGLLTKEELIKYARIADKYVGEGILIGYHGHNNMEQAFTNGTALIELGLNHDVILDASVYGMGRGAGNLNLELIGNYLKDKGLKEFNEVSLVKIWDKYLKKIYTELPWGYSMEYFFTAAHRCNPNYAAYYMKKKDLTLEGLLKILKSIEGEDKYLYSQDKAEEYYRKNL